MSGRASSSPVVVDDLRKQLPLRPRHDKPSLKYSQENSHANGGKSSSYTPSMRVVIPDSVPVNNANSATNYGASVGHKSSPPSNAYTNYMYMSGPGTPSGMGLSNTSVNLTPAQILSSSITTSTKVKKNPYARPISANDVEPHPSILMKSNSSNTVNTASVSHNNSSPVQVNSFLRPQSSNKPVGPSSSSPGSKSDSPPVGILKRSNSATNLPIQKPGFSSASLAATPLVEGFEAYENGLCGAFNDAPKPQPPMGTKPNATRPNSSVPKKVSISLPHESTPTSVPISASDTDKSRQNELKTAGNHDHGRPMAKSPSSISVSRGESTKHPAQSSAASAPSAIRVRNLNYTPTKPYAEVSDVKMRQGNTEMIQGKTDDLANKFETNAQGYSKSNSAIIKTSKDRSFVAQGPPQSFFKNSRHESVTEMLKDGSLKKMPVTNTITGTVYYRKGSKSEEILPKRPATEGAPAKPVTAERGLKQRQSQNEADEEIPKSCERLPGDGEDSQSEDDDDDGDDDDEAVNSRAIADDDEDDDDDDDDDDDIMDGLEDDDDDSDADSDGYSIQTGTSSGSSSRHSSTSLTLRRAHSATHRLAKLSLADKAHKRPITSKSRPASSVSAITVHETELQSPLTPSLFPNIPPTINFVTEQYKIEPLPWELRKLLKWKMSPITPNVIKNCIARSGFRATKKNYDWLGYWGKHMKAPGFKTIREYQKFNHFPGSFQIGRKDRLWRNLSRMQVSYGKREFNFFPQTFCLPFDMKQLKRVWEDGGNKQKWIIKPPASARGIGIKVISKWNQIPKKRPVIVQRYLARPYLINGSKFDLRVYVYVTSYDPLRIYVYDDGLTRFASTKYSYSMKSLSNKYMHLTNYSINKKNAEYESNTDENVCQGHKWGLKALWGYMKKQGVNANQVWESIKELVVKTILCSEACVASLVKANVRRRFNVHELFGFDVMLDENLKPWIIEVNISPSLHSNSQLDMNIKGGMIKDLLNLSGFTLPDKSDVTPTPGPGLDNSRYLPPHSLCIDKRLWPNSLSSDEKSKHAYYTQRHNDEYAQQTILDVLTPDDVRILTESIDEDSRRGNFERVFPAANSQKYQRFFEQPRYYNLLLSQWTQRYQRMEARGIALLESICERGIHLEHSTDNSKHQWCPPNASSLRDTRVVSAPATPRSAAAGFPQLRKTKKTASTNTANTNSNASSTAGVSRPPTNQSTNTTQS